MMKCMRSTSKICVITAILVCMALLLTGFHASIFAEDAVLYGDVDGNQKVDLSDAQQILRAALKIESLDDSLMNVADVDGDNNITLQDASWVLRYALHIVNRFPVQNQETPVTTVTPAASETPEAPDSKTLVVYFSATGSTRQIAEKIAKVTGGDLFELTPVNPYAAEDLDWTDSESRVCKEHADASLRDVSLTKNTPDDWDSYDTVFIGYPIWWGGAAWPVNHFITENDFTGKTVIPFCTSASSGLGNSGKLLEEMAGTGNWSEGRRFSGGASVEEVQKWIEGLNLIQK